MHSNDDAKLAYTIPEAVKAIGLGRTKLYQLINEGRLETRRIGKRVLIPAASLRGLLEAA